MPSEFERSVTVFVRHRVIGTSNTKVKPFADAWQVSKATVSDIRKGKTGVGGEVMAKIADAAFGGDMNRLRAEAAAFADQHPDLMNPAIPLLERAVGHLVLNGELTEGDLALAPTRAAYEDALRSVTNPDLLTFDAAIRLIREKIEAGPASSRRTADGSKEPPGGSELKNRNKRNLKGRKSSG